jgi:hypothetical protein
MEPKLEETIHFDFITSSPTTGAVVDADVLPTCELFEGANDTPILTPTVVKRSGKTGNYRVQINCTAANGFEAAKSYAVVVSATVGTVVAKARIGNFQMRARSVDDAAQVGAEMTLTSIYDAAKTAASPVQVNAEADQALADVGLTSTVSGRMDAAVSSRATPAQVQIELGNYGALKPTTAGRSLDDSCSCLRCR